MKLRPIRGDDIQMFPARPTGNEEVRTGRPEGLFNVQPHFVAAGPDRGPKRRQEMCGIRARIGERPNRRSCYPRDGAAPAGVGRRDAAFFRIDNEQGQAVGGFDGQKIPRPIGDTRIALRRLRPRRPHHPPAMNLFQEKHVSRLVEGASRRLVCLGLKPRHAPPEAVDQTRDVPEKRGRQEFHRLHFARKSPRGH